MNQVALPIFRVSTFGKFHLTVINGDSVQNITHWDGALPAQMAAYFIDKGMMTRDQIFHDFWPSLTVKEATNVFHVTKRKITERLKSAGFPAYDEVGLTSYANAFYILNTHMHTLVPQRTALNLFGLEYDVAHIDSAHENRDELTDEQILGAAMLYGGDFLPKFKLPWIIQRRAQIREKVAELYGSAARKQGTQFKRRSLKRETAIGYYITALELSPIREDFSFELMHLLIQNKQFAEARKIYITLQTYLADTLRIRPTSRVRDLYEEIKNK